MRLTPITIAITLLLGSRVLTYSSEDISWTDKPFRNVDRAFATDFARTVSKGAWMFSIDHRASEALDDEPLQNFLGFDSGNLKIGMGLRYGVEDRIDLGIARYNGTFDAFDVYQFDTRVRMLNEEDAAFDLGFRSGLSWYDETEKSDFSGFFGGFTLGKTLRSRIHLTLGILHHTESTGQGKTEADPDHSTALSGSINILLGERWTLTAEASGSIDGYDAGRTMWAAGPRLITKGHSFAIVVSNSQNISLDGLAAGSDVDSDPLFGFTITRRM